MDISSNVIPLYYNSILNAISIDKAAPISSSTKQTTLNCEQAPTLLKDSTTKVSMTENTQQSSPLNDEYVVEKIIEHDETPKDIRFSIRWYGYTSSYDTYEPSIHTPESFIIKYWKSRRARSNK